MTPATCGEATTCRGPRLPPLGRTHRVERVAQVDVAALHRADVRDREFGAPAGRLPQRRCHAHREQRPDPHRLAPLQGDRPEQSRLEAGAGGARALAARQGERRRERRRAQSQAPYSKPHRKPSPRDGKDRGPQAMGRGKDAATGTPGRAAAVSAPTAVAGRVQAPEHGHGKYHVAVLAADVDIAEHVVRDTPDVVGDPVQVGSAHVGRELVSDGLRSHRTRTPVR